VNSRGFLAGLAAGLLLATGLPRIAAGTVGRGRERPSLPPGHGVVLPRGVAPLPVFLIDFPDRPHTFQPVEFEFIFFGRGVSSLSDYYREVSLEKFDVSPGPEGIAGWFTAAREHDWYGADGPPPGDRLPGALVREAVAAADAAGYDFAAYDRDGDCVVDIVEVIHQGEGQDLEPHRNGAELRTRTSTLESDFAAGRSDGGAYLTGSPCPSGGFISVNAYSLLPEVMQPGGGCQPVPATVGLAAHELGKALGLPSLHNSANDIPYQAGAGLWSLMGYGLWAQSSVLSCLDAPGSRPTHLDAWSRYYLGWIEPVPIDATRLDLPIPRVEDSGVVYRILPGSPTSGEYFLLENRQRLGFDGSLPGEGLLVWHVDGDAVAANLAADTVNASGCWEGGPSCADRHYGVSLVEPDGVIHLQYPGGSTGDPNDAFPGLEGVFRSLSRDTVVTNDLYSGGPSGFALREISDPRGTMQADVVFEDVSGCGGFVADGGFEWGWPDNPWWDSLATTVGSPLCSVPACGDPGGIVGRGFAWFGGTTGERDRAYLRQQITLPVGREARITFRLRTGRRSGSRRDALRLWVDGRRRWQVLGTSRRYRRWRDVELDVSDLADGQPHLLSLESDVAGTPRTTDFFLDELQGRCVPVRRLSP
jgi:M6 family metalloprotease-like protein